MAQFYTLGGAVPIRIDRLGAFHWTKAKTGAQVLRGKKIYSGEVLFYENKYKSRKRNPHPVLYPALVQTMKQGNIQKKALNVAFKATFK